MTPSGMHRCRTPPANLVRRGQGAICTPPRPLGAEGVAGGAGRLGAATWIVRVHWASPSAFWRATWWSRFFAPHVRRSRRTPPTCTPRAAAVTAGSPVGRLVLPARQAVAARWAAACPAAAAAGLGRAGPRAPIRSSFRTSRRRARRRARRRGRLRRWSLRRGLAAGVRRRRRAGRWAAGRRGAGRRSGQTTSWRRAWRSMHFRRVRTDSSDLAARFDLMDRSDLAARYDLVDTYDLATRSISPLRRSRAPDPPSASLSFLPSAYLPTHHPPSFPPCRPTPPRIAPRPTPPLAPLRMPRPPLRASPRASDSQLSWPTPPASRAALRAAANRGARTSRRTARARALSSCREAWLVT